jgi:hypothetical protein
MDNLNSFEEIKEFYLERFNIPGELVDILSVSDILLMSVSGACNESIADTLEVDVDFVKEVLTTMYDFEGWNTDLTVNPYRIYSGLRVGVDLNLEEFSRIVGERDETLDENNLRRLFSMCDIYNKLENRIDSEWI